MTEGKQQLFLQRVLFSFDLAKRKAGKAQILRMSTTEWQQEADICCLGGYVLEKMRSARTSDNLVLFKKTTTDMVRSRFIEGDFHDDLKPLLESKDALFSPEEVSMWFENLPKKVDPAASQETLSKADCKIEALQLQQSKMQFEADALSLARDATQIAALYQKEMTNERANRLAKVTHLKQQNQMGSNLVMQHMRKNCRHVGGPITDLSDEILKDELNNSITMLSKALAALPEKSIGFVIAPHAQCVRELLPWTPESQYEVPTAEVVLHASEGSRALSSNQETAQLLAGPAMPTAVLQSLLSGADVGRVVGILNLSPYDGWLEKVALKWSPRSQRLEEMGDDIRKYDQTPPPLAEIALETVTLKLAEVTKDDSRKGRFKVTLTNEVRSRHLSDVVHAADWKRLITDFDTKFCGNMATVEAEETQIVPAEEKEEELPEWTSEPNDVQSLMDKYILEAKCPGRLPGTTLMLVQAQGRDGSTTDIVASQKYKLFLVCHQDDLELSLAEFEIGHGKSTFLKADKVAKLQREGVGSGTGTPISEVEV
ncbi:unnamed protein product [Durusdinium trenchii]|uniref:Uncharacterized protein n=1 Tax=Durusdinium trenchii TaxID=1381693 RepID=A0ABP0S4K3_9DINO